MAENLKEKRKEILKREIWDYFEKHDLANFPKCPRRRVPNFKGAEDAAIRLNDFDPFIVADNVRVNPNKAQMACRYLTLRSGKSLFVPSPRICGGLFHHIRVPQPANIRITENACSVKGMKENGYGIDIEKQGKLDLIIVGCVAASPNGNRITKGPFYEEIEYGLMKLLNIVTDRTVVITTVHDCQVMNISDKLMEPYDLVLDYILTPTKVIKCSSSRKKPNGLNWLVIPPSRLKHIPLLGILKYPSIKRKNTHFLCKELKKSHKSLPIFGHASESAMETSSMSLVSSEYFSKQDASSTIDKDCSMDHTSCSSISTVPLFVDDISRKVSSITISETDTVKCDEVTDRHRLTPQSSPRKKLPDIEMLDVERTNDNYESTQIDDTQRPKFLASPLFRKFVNMISKAINLCSDNVDHVSSTANFDKEDAPEQSSEPNTDRDKPCLTSGSFQETCRSYDLISFLNSNCVKMKALTESKYTYRRMKNYAVMMTGVRRSITISEIKQHVREQGVSPVEFLWRNSKNRVVLLFDTFAKANAAIKILKNFTLQGRIVNVSLSKKLEKMYKINCSSQTSS